MEVKDEEIIKKLEPYICKVHKSKNINDFEIGFLCKIPYPCRASFIHVLITSNKVIKTKLFLISFGNEDQKTFIYYYPERKIHKSKKYNIQFIEIFPNEDNIHNFLEFDDNIINNEDYIIKNKDVSLIIPYFSNINNLSIYLTTINKYECENIFKEVNFVYPIILLNSFKVIGINSLALFKYPFFEFIKNEITIKIKIYYLNLNQDIDILNKCYYYYDNDGIQQKFELKEITSSIVSMYINVYK